MGENLNALEAIQKGIEFLQERGRIANAIVVHPQWTTRGYVFVTESDNKAFLVVNSLDMTLAVAQMMMKEQDIDLPSYTMGVPVTENTFDVQRAISGRYLWTFPLT